MIEFPLDVQDVLKRITILSLSQMPHDGETAAVTRAEKCYYLQPFGGIEIYGTDRNHAVS